MGCRGWLVDVEDVGVIMPAPASQGCFQQCRILGCDGSRLTAAAGPGGTAGHTWAEGTAATGSWHRI